MKTTIVYTRSGKTSPSSNYRLLQYVPKMNGCVKARPLAPEFIYKKHANAKSSLDKLIWYSLYYGIIQLNLFRFMISDIINIPDTIIVSRAISPKVICFVNKFLIKKVFSNAKNLIWDFDDHIFGSKEVTKYEAELLTRYSKKIVVTSEYLKSLLPEYAREKVILMPTTDHDFCFSDIESVIEKRKSTFDKQIELLWLATAPSLPHLQKVMPILDTAANELKTRLGKDLILHVVCNKPIDYDPKYLTVDNILWSRQKAYDMVRCSHIGIMPLVNSDSSKGKGGFKIVQYMSASMPSIVSNIGFNKEIVINNKTGFLIDDDSDKSGWIDAVLKLSSSWDEYLNFSMAARKEWDRSFSYDSNLTLWNEII